MWSLKDKFNEIFGYTMLIPSEYYTDCSLFKLEMHNSVTTVVFDLDTKSLEHPFTVGYHSWFSC